ncbi:MAG: DUF3320 domain-containing protein, partial [Lachnospiraceae bacterium]|nr:DUF3320 domain-containing protein [Lachnospiraceae bacterium]
LENCLQKKTEPVSSADVTADTRTKVEALSADLSGYCDELRTPVGACGFTPYDLFGIREQYRYDFEEVKGERLPSAVVLDAANVTPEEYRAAVAALTDIVSYLPTLLREGETISTHPWAGTKPGRLLPADREEIQELARTFRDNIKDLVNLIQNTAAFADLPFVPKNEEGLSVFLETCREIGKEYPLTRDTLRNPNWQNKSAVAHLIEQYKNIYSIRKSVNDIFTPDIAAKDCKELYESFLKASSKGALSRMFSSGYKDLRAEIRACLKNPDLSDAEILTGLRNAKIYAAEVSAWAENKSLCASLFSPVWTGEDTNPELLEQYAVWIAVLRAWAADGRITDKTLQKIIDGKLTVCAMLCGEVEEKYQAAKTAYEALITRLHIENTAEAPEFSELENTAEHWVSDIERLEAWSRFLTYVSLAENTAAADSARLALNGKLTTDAIIPSFIVGYIDSLLNEAYQTHPRLAQFAQTPHEQKIETFKSLDKKILHENAKELTRKLSEQMPELFAGASRESEMGILAGEFNRKRGHMAIRTLMTKAGGLIQKIKPCFMMSPLSAAQYLDPRSVTFDIIIFDEASQVKPEDALGALMRGRQLVVMGDSRQLPPTSFFDSVGGNEVTDDDECSGAAEITDMESLLHACKQVYPVRRLTWHYRSRHESLIAVSNAEFYDGSLFVFPSPKHETDDLGLSFVHMKDAVYDRGNSGVNRNEAKAVAAAVIEYYRRFPDKTLGVATFSSKQQESIRREVDILLRDNPDVETLMHSENGEDFFVKNLETVQGDERDTILISIGYGFDEEHKLSRNFGPLNQAGGERRLNVLITRARERCVVFSNFRGYDLPITPETPRGVAALAAFLIYAETRNSTVLSDVENDAAESDRFADSVARMLTDNGYTVTRNVGCAGFRVDIAVSHPSDAGVFMAGIMCDGQNYWSAEDARDRDRLRTQILEGLGWNLIRIWAPEWFCAPKECEQKLLQKLEDAKKPISVKKKTPTPKEENPKVSETKKPAAPSGVISDEDIFEEAEPETPAEKEIEPVKKTPRKKPERKPDEERKAAKAKSAAAAAVQQMAILSVTNPPEKENTPAKEPRAWRNLPAEIGFPQYVSAKQCILQKYHEFASVQDLALKTAVVEIVAVEGPVSENMLYARIKELGNVSRMTASVKNRISSCIAEITDDGQLERDDEGFVSIPDGKLIPRVRGDKWSIADVSLSELLLAAQIILMRQYATPKAELAKFTAASLGFKATAQVKERSEKAVDMGIRLGIIIEENGLCTVKS